MTFIEIISNISICRNFLLPLGYPLNTVFCFLNINYLTGICLMEYFYCVDSNQIMPAVLFLYYMRLVRQLLLSRQCFFFFFPSISKPNVSNTCECINNSIKPLNGELNCSTLLWEKRQSKCFATCSLSILKTIFSYFKIYSPSVSCHCHG